MREEELSIEQIRELLAETSRINKRLDAAFIPKQSEPVEAITIKPAKKFEINKVQNESN
jgi:hypothetical protein